MRAGMSLKGLPSRFHDFAEGEVVVERTTLLGRNKEGRPGKANKAFTLSSRP